jgi:hypothetical protein
MLVLHILNIHWRGLRHYLKSVRTRMSDYHPPDYVEDPPPKIPDQKLSRVRYLVGALEAPSKFVPVTVCFFLFFAICAVELITQSAVAEVEILEGPDITQEDLVCCRTLRTRFVTRCAVSALVML